MQLLSSPEELSAGGFTLSDYASRRERLLSSMPEGSVAAVFSAPPAYMSGIIPYPYRPGTDLRYLTGLVQPGCLAIVSKACGFHLVVPDHDPERERWDGRQATPRAAVEALGADGASYASRVPSSVSSLVSAAAARGALFLSGRPAPEGGPLARAFSEWFRAGGRSPRALPLSRHLHRLRWKKDAKELALMRASARTASLEVARAAKRSGAAVRREGGALEGAIAAGFEARVRERGADRLSYPSVVAAGANATVVHYSRADCRGVAGQLLLMDAGCELDGYCSDVTRAWPLSGAFSPAQRDVYQAVLDARRACAAAVRPGATLREMHAISVRTLAQAMADLGLLDRGWKERMEREQGGGAANAAANDAVNGAVNGAANAASTAASSAGPAGAGSLASRLASSASGLLSGALPRLAPAVAASRLVTSGRYRELYPHSVGHWLGMDTHDSADVSHDTPLEEGVVLTIEPGLYVPDDPSRFGPYAGIGVRLEDDIAVTATGAEVLSCLAPLEVPEVEACVQGVWMLQGDPE